MAAHQTSLARRLLTWLMPATVAVLCFLYVPSTVWGGASGILATALSLITAAILVRIMRGFPVTDPDGFEDESEIVALEYALRKVMTRLSWAAGLAVCAILMLVFRSVLVELSVDIPRVDDFRGELYSAVLGFVTALVVLRIVSVVRLDASILGVQAQAVRNSFTKKRIREAAAARRGRDDTTYTFADSGDYPGRAKSGGR